MNRVFDGQWRGWIIMIGIQNEAKSAKYFRRDLLLNAGSTQVINMSGGLSYYFGAMSIGWKQKFPGSFAGNSYS